MESWNRTNRSRMVVFTGRRVGSDQRSNLKNLGHGNSNWFRWVFRLGTGPMKKGVFCSSISQVIVPIKKGHCWFFVASSVVGLKPFKHLRIETRYACYKEILPHKQMHPQRNGFSRVKLTNHRSSKHAEFL